MTEAIIIIAVAVVIALAVSHTVKKAQKGGGCCGEHEAAEKKVRVSDRNKSHYPYITELKIGGMTCENCSRRVENALNSLDGVWAAVDIGSRRATVRTKKKPDVNELRRAVMNAGYIVTDIIQNAYEH